MKCPLFSIGDFTAKDIKEWPDFDCHKKECGWWDGANKRCAVLGINIELIGIGHSLKAMSEKLLCDVQQQR